MKKASPSLTSKDTVLKQNNISLFNDILTSNSSKEKNSFLIKPSNIVTRNLPPAIKQWVNSIYSFNQNYTKTIPVLDIIVNKIIRGFFSINPLANNPDGKKSRLVQRRFKRLSLNRIFVSKPEIKHNSDKVFVTVYLFNKKKISLLYKLKHLYKSITHKKIRLPLSKISFLSTKKNIKAKASKWNKNRNKNRNRKKGFSLLSPIRKRKNFIMTGKIAARLYRTHKASIGKTNSLYRLVRKSKKLTVYSRYKINKKNARRKGKYFNKKIARTLYKNFYLKCKAKAKSMGDASKTNRAIFSIATNRNVVNYKKTSLLTKVKIQRFLEMVNKKAKNSILSSKIVKKTYKNKPRNLDSGILVKTNNLSLGARSIPSFSCRSAILKTYYSALNKYKLFRLAPHNNFIINSGLGLALKVQDNKNLNYNALTMQPAINKPILQICNIYKYINLRQRFMLGLYKPYALSKIGLASKRNRGFYALKKGNVNLRRGQSSLQMVNALYKLFLLYSDVKFYQDSVLLKSASGLDNNVIASKGPASYNKKVNSLSLYSSKITLTTYKLLKKFLPFYTKKVSSKHTDSKKKSKNQKNKNNSLLNKYDKYKSRLLWLRKVKGKKIDLKRTIKKLLLLKKTGKMTRLSRIYLKRTIKRLLLLQKMRRINRFFWKYSKALSKTTTNSNVSKGYGVNRKLYSNENNILSISQRNVAAMHKLNYIKGIVDKDLLYVYYLKMLCFNTNLFKNWFLNGLKNILSKIYNKKVVLNLVSLKYIHLNSDIFTQAITIRLRNFKINRLNIVLRKALKLIVLSKINNYSYDPHSPVNKFLANYYSKFKQLNMDIFNDGKGRESNSTTISKEISMTTPLGLTINYSPKAFKGLTSVQSSTINFIKHKSVFGVRLEAAGRLTKRSTASRAVFKIRYKGNLRNNPTINRKDTSTMIKDQRISNLQFTKIASKTRNGSFGLKGWLNNN